MPITGDRADDRAEARLEKQLAEITASIAAIDKDRDRKVARQHVLIRKMREKNPKRFSLRKLGNMSGMTHENIRLITEQ